MNSSASHTADETIIQSNSPQVIASDDVQILRQAYMTMEHPSLAARLSNVIGTPIELAMGLLPRSWYKKLHGTAENALGKALSTAVSSMRRHHTNNGRELYYRGVVGGCGALSGFFGLPGLLVELPITTTLMLRGIAEIARAEGEDIHDANTQAACLQVFALGGKTEIDDAADTGYYGVRLALSSYTSASIAHVSSQGLAGHSAPVLVQLIRAVAKPFGISLSQRAAAQTLPVIGAAGAAAVNVIFIHHFQDMAKAHFIVRRLERKYGEAFIRARYEEFEQQDQVSR
jgi:hypothetical protein